MLRCDDCAQRMACGYYGICLDGRVTQPHHRPAAPVEDRWDRDEASEKRPKRRKKR